MNSREFRRRRSLQTAIEPTSERTVDLHDARCVTCGQARLVGPERCDPSGILRGAIVCTACAAEYDILWGVPFIGAFESDDFLGLFENIANAQSNLPSAELLRRLDRLLNAYHMAPDKKAMVAASNDPFLSTTWWPYRYSEWLQMKCVAGDEDYAGKNALDVGAGGGIDALRLSDAGARVTAIDYGPSLIQRGSQIAPAARWFGGFSHVLPFRDESFDYVFANAALHHMRDPSAAMFEMLRVVKVGGSVITAGDGTRADDSALDHEFHVFNKHDGVLRGINETIPRFSSIFGPLAQYAHALDIKLAGLFHHLPEPLDGTQPVDDGSSGWFYIPVTEANIDRMKRGHSSICLAARKLAPIAIPAATQKSTILPAGEFAKWLGQPTAIPKLLSYISSDVLDRPFPGHQQSKFELLNGWMMPEAPFEERVGYARARWFLRHPPSAGAISFEVRPQTAGPGRFQCFINAEERAAYAVETNDWQPISMDIASVPSTFVVELRFDRDHATTFEDHCFAVRHRQFH
jgi:SAM-dependent methyltransferase